MKRFFLFFFASLCAVILVCSQVNVLERCTPESQGVPSEKITALFDSLMTFPNTDIHSVMVLRHGKVIAEMYPAPFKPEYGHQLFSCSKTFTAAAVGIGLLQPSMGKALPISGQAGSRLPHPLQYFALGIAVAQGNAVAARQLR